MNKWRHPSLLHPLATLIPLLPSSSAIVFRLVLIDLFGLCYINIPHVLPHEEFTYF